MDRTLVVYSGESIVDSPEFIANIAEAVEEMRHREIESPSAIIVRRLQEHRVLVLA